MFRKAFSKCKRAIDLDPEYNINTHRRVIILYDQDEQYVKEFKKVQELADFLGMKRTSVISAICRNRKLQRKYKAIWTVVERDLKARQQYYHERLKKELVK